MLNQDVDLCNSCRIRFNARQFTADVCCQYERVSRTKFNDLITYEIVIFSQTCFDAYSNTFWFVCACLSAHCRSIIFQWDVNYKIKSHHFQWAWGLLCVCYLMLFFFFDSKSVTFSSANCSWQRMVGPHQSSLLTTIHLLKFNWNHRSSQNTQNNQINRLMSIEQHCCRIHK